MKTNKLDPVYNPRQVEDKIYSLWLERDCFRAVNLEPHESFSIVIPPPNVTGTLHMGHALDNTLQDVLIRWKRMQQWDTLWLPGTDHAGIATQIKVEEHIREEGVDKHDLGREAFLEKAWEWKDRYHHRITEQLQKLGVSCDWSRERFTLDEGCSRAVREVFVSLYRKGLIYRGDYMINWCPSCHTALSDIEVEHAEENSTLTYISYPVAGKEDSLIVATTRPETMLGDTAVAVHPEDDRYRHLIGKKVTLPLMEREIPVIADEYVDPSFGTGAVKVTPGHDPNDREIGFRHNLDVIQVIGNDAFMTSSAGSYEGLERWECRRLVVEDLHARGLVEKIEEYSHAPGRCQRCNTVVEPIISLQWFVKMEPLAIPASAAVREGNVRFVPERFANVYLQWMDNIKDWCISRQIWWGHRIPAWYCACGETIVDYQEPLLCPHCGAEELTQDPDVLDTWFSSALWPFSTMGWPDKTADLHSYFPTDVLVTGYDIIYFWVARMIVMSLEFMQEVPFYTVYIHGLVRDALGRKMSKSLGNGIDPIDFIDQYGADTLRFTLITGQAPGNDQRFRQESVEASRNFANKIWNVSRFVLMNLNEGRSYGNINPAANYEELERVDRWILHRFNRTVKEVNSALNNFELGEAARKIYEFLWHDYCDWYVEFSKLHIYKEESEASNEAGKHQFKLDLLVYILDGTLRLLHPFMPFITEEIWQYLPLGGRQDEETLVAAIWPEYNPDLEFAGEAAEMELIQEIVHGIRNLRSQVNLPPSQKAPVILRPLYRVEHILQEEMPRISSQGGISELTVDPDATKPAQALTAIIGEEVEIYLPLAEVINLEEEIERLKKEMATAGQEMQKNKHKLDNQDFLEKAPQEVISKVKGQYEEALAKYEKLKERLQELEKMF